MSGFFVTGEAATRRHAEIAEREQRHFDKQCADAAAIERMITEGETDREMAQLITLSQLIDPDSWGSRESWFQMAERERTGPMANRPGQERHVQRARNMGSLAVEPSLRKARSVLDLIGSWGLLTSGGEG